MKRRIPAFKTDRAAADFVDKADLTRYDLSGAQLTRFEIKPKDKSINLRLSEELYIAVRERAARAGVPYQRFIRLTLEQAIAPQMSGFTADRLFFGVGSFRAEPSPNATNEILVNSCAGPTSVALRGRDMDRAACTHRRKGKPRQAHLWGGPRGRAALVRRAVDSGGGPR